jgi:hypothetical protein
MASHGLAPSSCESVRRLKLTRISQLYSRRSVHNSDCSLVHQHTSLHGLADGHSRPIGVCTCNCDFTSQGLNFVLLRQAYEQREKRCCVQSADLLFEQLQLL